LLALYRGRGWGNCWRAIGADGVLLTGACFGAFYGGRECGDFADGQVITSGELLAGVLFHLLGMVTSRGG
jgi:hypothetical protein